MKKPLVLLPLVFVLLASGCVNNFPLVKSKVEPQTVQESADLLVIEDLKVTPSLVFTDTEFTVSFKVRHVGDPKTSKKVTARITAYDFGPCTPESETSFSKTFFPQQEEYFEIKVKAPSASRIANLEAKCPVRIKLSYNYTAVTQVEAYVMTQEKYNRLAKAGKEPSYTPKQTVGIGPVKIYFEFFQPQPFISGKQVTFLVYAKNLGTGDVKGSVNLNIAPEMSCEGKENLEFIKKETRKVKCTWKPSLSGEEEKMYYLTAKATYKYETEKVADVVVKPLPE